MADRQGFFGRFFRGAPTRVASAATATVRGISSGSLTPALSAQGGMMGLGGYSPQEPFVQAWQKNMDGKNHRDPLMLAFSAVYACVEIISQDIAKMPIQLMNIDQVDGVSQSVAMRNAYHRLLRNPNDYQTALQFVQFMVACILMRGNAYILQVFDQRGVPNQMHLLHPDRVKVLVHPMSKEVFYEYSPHANDMAPMSEVFTERETTFVIPSRYIIHHRINCLWHPLVGVSPLYAGAVSAATGGRIMMNSERFFGNMSRPSGVLTSDGEIGDVTAERLKREFEANYSGGNIGKTAVLGDGLKWQSMVLTSVDAQLIEQLKWTIEDVARVFRVPMYLLNDTTRMTYKNSEQAAQSYFQGCLQFHVEAIEAEFAKAFNVVEGVQEVRFDVSVLFRMDMEERFNAYGKGITSGVISPNEARAMEGKGPIKGGEEPRMQMQYVPLSQIEELNAQNAAKPVGAPAPAPAPAPEPDDEPTPASDDEDDEERAAEAAERLEYDLAAQNEMMAIISRMANVAGRADRIKQLGNAT